MERNTPYYVIQSVIEFGLANSGMKLTRMEKVAIAENDSHGAIKSWMSLPGSGVHRLIQ